MKLFVIAIFFIVVTASTCKNNKMIAGPNCFKGKLEIKGPCLNYTVRLLKETIDTSIVSADWINESTGKKYKNVFALGSRCNFPDSIKEGDDFYFTIDSSAVQYCAVCMIYYPVPTKKLFIKVLEKPCIQ